MVAYDLDQRTTPEVVRISKPSSILKLFWSVQMESREALRILYVDIIYVRILVSYLVRLDPTHGLPVSGHPYITI